MLMDRLSRRVVFCCVLVSVSNLVPGRLGAEEVTNFFNVIAPRGADPWVWRHDGWYYATVTTGSNVTLMRSRWLSTLGAAERRVVWSPPADSPYSRSLWAPEIHRVQGGWYLYVAADDGRNANHRMYVLENKADDPFEGRFEFKGQIGDTANDRWAIDGTVFQNGESLYFVWSGWAGSEDVRQDLYIAPMANPWTLAGPRVEISRPTLPWETRGAPPAVNEGPQALIHDGRIHLAYSASGSWTDSYCLGILTASVDADLLSPTSWKKQEEPIFASDRGVYGPGHCSFVKSPDGREDWLVYHAARFQGAGWNRLIRAQPFSWSHDGRLRLGRPANPDRPIPIPGGEPVRQRLEAESAEWGGDARRVEQPRGSGGAHVELPDQAGSFVAFKVNIREADAYVLSIRYLNASKSRVSASHNLTINDRAPTVVQYDSTGPAGWSNSLLPITLKQGLNSVRLDRALGAVAVDSVDLIPNGESAGVGR